MCWPAWSPKELLEHIDISNDKLHILSVNPAIKAPVVKCLQEQLVRRSSQVVSLYDGPSHIRELFDLVALYQNRTQKIEFNRELTQQSPHSISSPI